MERKFIIKTLPTIKCLTDIAIQVNLHNDLDLGS